MKKYIAVITLLTNILCGGSAFAEPLEVDLAKMVTEYQENAYKFKQKYINKDLSFSALVASIEDQCYITSDGEDIPCVLLMAKDEVFFSFVDSVPIPVHIASAIMYDDNDLSNLSKGQEISMICRLQQSRVINDTTPLVFENCRLDAPNSLSLAQDIFGDLDLVKNITPEQLEEYIAQGADVNAKDNKSKTALMIASGMNQNPAIIETLIKHGADVNAKNNQGETALMIACANNPNPEIIEMLIKHGANIEAKIKTDEYGFTPLMFAALANPNPKVIHALLDHGAIIPSSDLLLKFLDTNIRIEKNKDYWSLRDRIYNK